MSKTLKKKCCKSYRKKGKACSTCPLMVRLAPEDRDAVLSAYKKSKKKPKKKKREKWRKKADALLEASLTK